MSFVIAQILGLVATVTSISVYQFKNEKIILLGQFLTNFFMAVNFGLLGGLSAAWICMVAAFETLLIFLVNKKCKTRKKLVKNTIVVIAMLIFLAGTIVTYSGWPDILTCICAFLYTVSVAQEDSGKIRSIMLFNASLWIIYDITLGAWTSIITHVLTLGSIIAGMVRLDRKKQDSQISEQKCE